MRTIKWLCLVLAFGIINVSLFDISDWLFWILGILVAIGILPEDED